MITIACVWTGNKYPLEYVVKLRRMISLHLPLEHEFVCLTDNDAAAGSGYRFVDISEHCLPGWWGKMALFSGIDYKGKRVIYFDLDTVILKDISELAEYNGSPFAICENFTKRAGHPTWPCNYGSCVMSFLPEFGRFSIWEEFIKNRGKIMSECRRGDQEAIERLWPDATYLQDVLPDDYFVGYRDFTKEAKGTIAIFAGNNKPHASRLAWVKENWK